MFEKTVRFQGFDGVAATEKLVFNLTIPEVAELEFEFSEGFEAYVREAVRTKSNKNLFLMFKLLMSLAYGRRSADGKSFLKRKEWLDELFCGLAYEELFVWLFSKEENAAAFFNSVMPKDVEKKIGKYKNEPGDSEAPKTNVQSMTREELEAALFRTLENKKPANED